MPSLDAPVASPTRPAAAGDGCIAVVNAGSSSVKFGLYAIGDGDQALYRGKVEGIGASPQLRVTGADGAVAVDRSLPPEQTDQRSAVREVLMTAADLVRGTAIGGIGHRVAHGGTAFASPTRIDARVLDALRGLIPLAPLHQPHNLAAIDAIAEAAPHIPQVAVFDTAFHRTQPELAELFGLPRRFADEGVRRYGFHGISYEYIAGRLKTVAPRLAEGRTIVAHLGSGASLCALQSGRSVATTMGFTPLDGVIMGTRCGALDPGVLLYLMDQGMGPREIEALLYRQSGLLGLSGVSPDMRVLRASAEPAAREAIGLFVYRAVREIGSLAAALGGLDGLVFTGGIGENDPETRRQIAEGCAWLGLRLDVERNDQGPGRISLDGSDVEAWVAPTDEEAMIARHTATVLALG
jgi:acetate kinase